MPPDSLAHYRIVRLLGRGGMGEVYLAEDLTLGRQVALKVLPPGVAATGRERFEREARAVAALNHPNIVTLHSIDQSGETPFLTMEFVDGKALNELIPASGMPLDRLLKIAIPLSDAVGAAHQRGILHRDLKPANVMITADGRVKVLDFGLAKLQEDIKATAALPTQAVTGEGRLVGTVGYLSHEPAQGQTVHPRSDAVALGVILYELATGKRPFTGDTSLSVLSAILTDTPRPVGELRPDIPRDFARIVKRALNKDPEERYQSAKDLRNDLHAVLDDLTSGELAIPASTAPPGKRSLTPLTMLALVALVVAVAVAVWAIATRLAAPASAPVAETWTPSRLTSSGAVRSPVAISPDGRYVAYAQFAPGGGQGLWLRQVATNTDAVIRPPAPGGYDGLTFSRDGSFVYYSVYPAGDNVATLYRMPVIGGAPTKILHNLDTSVTFSPDGTRMAYVINWPTDGRSVLEVAAADGSGRRALAELKRPDQFLYGNTRPTWSPDGSTIAIAVVKGPGQTIALVDAKSGAIRMPGEQRWPVVNSGEWLPGGHDLIASLRDAASTGSQLWRVDSATGMSVRVTNDLYNYQDLGVSADGRLVVAVAALNESTLWTADADRLAALSQATT